MTRVPAKNVEVTALQEFDKLVEVVGGGRIGLLDVGYRIESGDTIPPKGGLNEE